jgi:phosphatidate cytidylyltransferase
VLKTRLIIGTILIAALLGALWIDLRFGSGYASLVLVVLAGVGGAIEWNRIVSRGPGTYPGLLVMAALVYPVLESVRIKMAWPAGLTDFVFLFAFTFLLLARAIFAGHVQEGLDRIARTLFGFICLYLFYRLIPILLDPEAGEAGGGILAVYCLVLTSKSCDIGAFLIGFGLGKRKLIPRVSPGKTVAGAVGGLTFSTITGALTLSLMTGRSPWWGLVFGLVIGAVTMLSDLAESLIKRCGGVKDSASLLPQFGGVLDLIDSLILAAPAGYLLLMIL